jgi:hypothetical protein
MSLVAGVLPLDLPTSIDSILCSLYRLCVRLQAAESGGGGGELVTDAEGHMHVEKVVQVSTHQQ